MSAHALPSAATGAAVFPSSFPASTGERFSVATADGLRLAAERYGNPSGPEILLLHGLGQSRLSWSRQTQGALADTHLLVSYDLRGHGDSSKPQSAAAYEDPALWAADLYAVIEAAGLRRPTVVGWSLGALVAGPYVRRYGPGRIGGVNAVGAVTYITPALLGPVSLALGAPLLSPDLATRTEAVARFLAEIFVVPPPEAELRRMLVVNGAAVFLVTGAATLGGATELVAPFGTIENATGLGDWLRVATGLLEVLGGLLLCARASAGVGVVLLGAVMGGAALMHLLALGTAPTGPAVLLAALAVVAYAHRFALRVVAAVLERNL